MTFFTIESEKNHKSLRYEGTPRLNRPQRTRLTFRKIFHRQQAYTNIQRLNKKIVIYRTVQTFRDKTKYKIITNKKQIKFFAWPALRRRSFNQSHFLHAIRYNKYYFLFIHCYNYLFHDFHLHIKILLHFIPKISTFLWS